MSFLGPEQRVDLYPANSGANIYGADFGSANASSSNGTSVAVWVNAYSSSDHDIWAQRFDKSGNATGAPIMVDYTSADSSEPSVATDATGRFVVTWINSNGTNRDVEMRYFGADGTALTGIVRVNSNAVDDNPDVAASNGSFVITWSQWYPTDYDVYAERFVIGGVPVAQGIFGVNASTASSATSPSVAMSPSGAFDITYQVQPTGSSHHNDIRLLQYNSSGVFLTNLAVNIDGCDETNPDVAMDNVGNAVVAYQRFIGGDWGIYANRVSSGGSVSGMITVRDLGGINETEPSVALAPTGGLFAVAYTVDHVPWGSGIQVSEMSSTNTVLTVQGPTPGSLPTYNSNPSISIDGSNHYLVTFDRAQGIDVFYHIFSQRGVLVAGNPAADTAYSPVSGSLFGANGPSYLDVHQGAVGDCWLLASLAEVAARDPQDIRNMFTYEGTIVDNGATVGLYTVRFFDRTSGSADYVQVDTELPSAGGYYDHPANGVLWVALAEKAYAVANGLGYVITNNEYQNSYSALNGPGWPSWALQAITGRPAGDYTINSTNLASDWNAGQLIVLDSSTNAGDNLIVGHLDAQGKPETHAYAVIGYNASSSTPFELYNPWGLSSVVGHTSNYNGHQVYDGPFWFSSSLISQDFAWQSIGTGTAAGLDGHGNMPLVLTGVPHKARAALHHDFALDVLQQDDFDLSWVA